MKKRLFPALVFIFCLCLCLCACNSTSSDDDFDIFVASEIKNVIIIIGDGMGFNHIENTKTYYSIDKFDFENDFVFPITTHSRSNSVTDSAAAATALATGQKADNGAVGRVDGQDITNIMQIAQSKNKKTGIITTDYLYGATPACYSSHADNRNDKTDIINGQAESGIDLFIGQRHKNDLYSADFNQKFVDGGYIFASTSEELSACDKSQKILANLDGLRSKYNDSLSGQIDFSAIVEYTLDYLDNENGFCLMIEHAHIDKCSHGNDLNGAICEMRALADTVAQVYSFCKGRNDTAVLITADHETGGLQLARNANQLSDALYTSTGHTGADVPLYVKNVSITKLKQDNTSVFLICKKIIENN